MYRVEAGQIWFGDKKLAPADKVLIDNNEGSLAALAKSKKKFKADVFRLPVGDIIFATTPENKIVGIESKKPHDLSNSQRNRRLQDQLSRLRESVDIPLLGLRLMRRNSLEQNTSIYTLYGEEESTLVQEIAKWVNFGGLILLPASDAALLGAVQRFRTTFTGHGGHIYSIITGRPKVKRTGSAFSVAVQGLGVRIGPKRATDLEAFYKGDFMRFIQAPEEEIYGLVKSKAVVERLRALRSTD